MPTFDYIAIDAGGRRVSGRLSENDVQSATRRIREQGYYPTEIRSAGDRGPATVRPRAAQPVQSPSGSRGRARPADIALFSRQLANLVRGGLPLLHAFSALIDHTDNPRLRDSLIAIRQSIEEGNSLSEAMADQGGMFPPLYSSMVRAGEASGDLQGVLEWLANLLESEQAKRAQIRAALAYPTLLVLVGSLAVAFLLIFLIPKFTQIYADLNQALPMPTVVLLAISNTLARYWWAIVLGGGALHFALKQAVRTPTGRYVWDRLKLRLPLAGKLQLKIIVARLSRTLATLLRGGVPILAALDVVRDVLGNSVMAAAVAGARTKVREGESIADPLRETGLFPSLLTHMIAVGEKTGDLPGVLDTVADTYDVEVENSLKGLVSMVEPLIILTMGTIIAFIVIAMLLPIFQMNLFAG